MASFAGRAIGTGAARLCPGAPAAPAMRTGASGLAGLAAGAGFPMIVTAGRLTRSTVDCGFWRRGGAERRTGGRVLRDGGLAGRFLACFV